MHIQQHGELACLLPKLAKQAELWLGHHIITPEESYVPGLVLSLQVRHTAPVHGACSMSQEHSMDE